MEEFRHCLGRNGAEIGYDEDSRAPRSWGATLAYRAAKPGDRRARFPFPAPIIWRTEALLVEGGEESVDQADEFILEFRRTKER